VIRWKVDGRFVYIYDKLKTHIMKAEIRPSKENTLYLPIKKEFFNEIIAGRKKEEYRELKDTTYKKYLALDEDGSVFLADGPVDDANLDECGFAAYNGGDFPFVPFEYKFLNLAAGYGKERDSALVEVTGVTTEIEKNDDGHELIFAVGDDDQPHITSDGPAAFWLIVYHLGKVVELHRRGE
jgi:hypothetical protein